VWGGGGEKVSDIKKKKILWGRAMAGESGGSVLGFRQRGKEKQKKTIRKLKEKREKPSTRRRGEPPVFSGVRRARY